ncbi:MAG: cobyrinate a,c-diamide synthase, partial [Actinomycetia bacterium]|nr:cobyrinate a,c-diamide synthase [Actinomycetes bacterium]
YSHDRAFSFFYHENIKIMESMGAECKPFSPIDDPYIDPDTDLLMLWGGFPEIFAPDISSNKSLINQINELIEKGLPVYAECGGLMYLAKNFISGDNEKYPMIGTLPVDIKLGDKLVGFGYKEAAIRFDTILGKAGTKVRGHEFHYSFELGKVGDDIRPYKVKRKSGDKESERLEGYVYKNVFASYIHLHFLGNLGVVNNIFKNISKKDRKKR